ncbi:2-hydroxyacid dehydrogenase [Acerihabitans arboris]|uniref:2-hydroxyacid dehydrogenase n=1 Tax=Acerihabitans arboris TaxID=2691583 RepID=A0A845SP45_9GAMM|nr:2-hydroxyacid dehydrogenase [Acerihabitans arboris]NDL64704.1 2-hydroxyacid dehydrogenase [Acerihabitans arboris]
MNYSVIKAAMLPDALTRRLEKQFNMADFALLPEPERWLAAQQARVLVVNGESTLTEAFIAQFPKLELIADFGVGYDGIDVAAAARRSVEVCNTPDVLTEDVADMAMGLLLATSRQIVGAQRFIEQGGWRDGGYPWTKKVSGGRLGIIGMGRIGQAIARRAAAFDMVISYHDYRQLPDGAWPFYASVVDLAAASDFLVVCVNGGEKTRSLVNARVLAALGAEGILINIARGTVVDEADLVHAVKQGIIGGAGLDVFSHEPEVPAALFNRPNVVVTPHMASATHDTRRAMSDLVFDNIAAFLAGKPLLTPVAPY